MTSTEALIVLQRQFEEQHAEEGANRYFDAQDKKANTEGFDRRADVQKMIRGAVPIVTEGLRKWIEEASLPKKGRPSSALAPLKELDPDVVALSALSRTFSTLARGLSLSTTAEAIGKTVQVEVEALMIQEADPKAAKRFLKMTEGDSSERTTLKRHEALKAALEVGLEWSRRTQVLVGGTVLNVILKALPDIFLTKMVTDQRGTTPIVALTEEALDHISEMASAAAWMHPLLKPMVVEPRMWDRFDTGCYLEYQVSRTVPLVKTFNREHQKMIRAAIKDGSMQEELDALNAIQGTRFAIDARVLEVMKWVQEEQLQPSKSFPLMQEPDKAPKIAKEEWEALDAEVRAAKSRQRKSVNNLRSAASVNKAVLKTDIAEADRLKDFPCFYLPHSMDFRGRVYAVPHFNPQRSDHVKALFKFADTVPMGPEGGKWLSIHLANCGDFKLPNGRKASKGTFPDRVQWVQDNADQLIAVAMDPKATFSYWKEADSPFCFLQACFEYADWAASGYSEAFEGSIGVALDGSCSGLQHYSAMTRSEEEGFHVNLLPRDVPGDIYQVTADKALPGLKALAQGGDEACTLILANGFGRGEVKRNVMTYFYGSEKFGMRDQHMVDTMRPLADEVALGNIEKHPYAMLTERTDKDTGESTFRLDGGFTCAQVMAAHVYHAIVSVAPKADEASNWFRAVASTLAHESLPVIWRTPTGLPVMQKYSEYTSKQITMWLYDRSVTVPEHSYDKVDSDGSVLARVQLLIREAPTKRIDKKKARSAISPNVVHSLDASHLKRTVVMAKAEGIHAFQLIHDSFATHAGNTGRFFQIIREAFVNQYETYCPFQALLDYANSVLSEEGKEKLPAIPARGTLDLSRILESDYAFA